MRNLFLLLFVIPMVVLGALPEITNYSTDDYPGHSLNFSITEDTSGVMLFANAYSILEFDGMNWRSIPTNNHVSPCAFASDKKGTVYVGLFSDLGYLDKDEKGKTFFVSLKEKVKSKDLIFPKIYHVAVFGDKVYYCAQSAIYIYDGKSITTILPSQKNGKSGVFSFLGKIADELVFFDNFKGLGKIVNGKAIYINASMVPESHWVVSAFTEGNNKYTLIESHSITVFENGVFSTHSFYQNGNAVELSIYHAIKLKNGLFALATEQGVLLSDMNGNIVKTFNKKKGLASNNVNFLYEDKKGNVWAAMNNGISLLKINSAIAYLNDIQGVDGMGYSAQLKGDTLYLGTSQGLYFMPSWLKNKDQYFSSVEGIGRVNYDMKLMKDKLLCADIAEFYEVNGSSARLISKNDWASVWNLKKIPGNDTLIICGTYHDFRIYAYRKGHWVYRNTLQGFKESARMFEFDEHGVLWLVQGISGLFKIKIDKDFRKVLSVENYVEKYKYAADYFNDIVKVKGKIKISSDGGVYVLNGKDELIKDEQFSEVKELITRLRFIEGSLDELYFIRDERPVFIELVNGKYKVKKSSPATLKDKLVGSAEFIYKVNTDVYLIATQQGFAVYYSNRQEEELLPTCLIRKVFAIEAEEDSVLLMGKNIPLRLSYFQNSVAFHFSLPYFGSYHNNVLYHTELLDDDGEILFKDASLNSFKEYTNLREGDYVFKVWVNINGRENKAVLSYFSVSAPWYRSWVAYFFYLLILVAVIVFVRKNMRQRLERQAHLLEEKRLKDLQKSESMHKAELLAIELHKKNEEMGFMALHFAQKKQFLSDLKDQFNQFSRKIKDDNQQAELRSLIRNVSMDDREEESWQKFQIHFDQDNNNFFQKLKEFDPRMNESTLLMCSYIKMGKSNKEIADLLNISLSGVEKRKYRLKEKFGLTETGAINEFLNKL